MTSLNVEPKYDKEEAKKLSITTPSLIGKSVSNAKDIVTNSGLEYKIVGSGKTVISQSPSASSKIPSGGVVVLYTEKKSKKTTKIPDFSGMSVSEANAAAAEKNINIEISGNDLSSSSVIAYRQSVDAGTEAEIGTVVTVSFKNTKSVLD